MSTSRDSLHKSVACEMKGFSSRAGYSLIELLTVIAIIGILTTIAIPTYHGYRDKARMTTIYTTLRHVRFSQELYFTDYGEYFGFENVLPGPGSYELSDSDVEIYIPNQQIWAISSSKSTAEDDSTEIVSHKYTILIDTNMDRDQNGERDQYEYYKKADAGGSTIEESDFFPLTPIAVGGG